MEIKIRKSEKKDCEAIMRIIEQATKFLGEQGSPQWQNGYGPTQKMILKDIEKDESYVLLADQKIVGTAALVSGVDPVYTAIKEGAWKESNTTYLSIHRVAIDGNIRGKGLAKQLLSLLISEAIEKGIRDIRIDTFPENTLMEKAIFSSGFAYQGEIEFPIPHGERKAYQFIHQ
ncbi:hypothetical protein IGI37_001688 [Enterococcus sp. AZ194]|uniref:GNAT family N-acetyltransferase n=1 Tax=Enterococcus sp. AZ194 TaxID=2774629 RepID=UPI003F22E182